MRDTGRRDFSSIVTVYAANALSATVPALSKTVCQLQLLKNRSRNETSAGGAGNTKGTRAWGIFYRAASRAGTAARGLRTCVSRGMRWPTAAPECETCVTHRDARLAPDRRAAVSAHAAVAGRRGTGIPAVRDPVYMSRKIRKFRTGKFDT